MNFNVDNNYRQAVQNFTWNENVGENPLQDDDFTDLVNETAKEIIGASKLRPVLQNMSGKELTLLETCYLVVQSKDQRVTNPQTITRIQNPTAVEKTILSYTAKSLSEMFDQVKQADVNGMTLLFSIHRVHDIAAQKIIALPQPENQIQDLKTKLLELIELRDKYTDRSLLSIQEKTFLAKVDQAIIVKTIQLDKMSSEDDSKAV